MSDLSHPLDVAVQERSDDPGMQRSISWNGAFWIASGVPALVLFSIGSIAVTVGAISPRSGRYRSSSA